ncbi:MAG: pyrroline-5-carboxylate reductase dimerization domain-containing protein [Deinococcales bacterium]
MLAEKSPSQLKDEVCSPGGTSIAGVSALEEHGLRHAVMSAVEAASKRARVERLMLVETRHALSTLLGSEPGQRWGIPWELVRALPL